MKLYDKNSNSWYSHRATQEYMERKQRLRDAWTVLGMILIIAPLPLKIALALAGTFLSLAYLDERPYDETRPNLLAQTDGDDVLQGKMER